MKPSASGEAAAILHALSSLRDHEIDVGLALLWLSKIEYPNVSLEGYFGELDKLALTLQSRLGAHDTPRQRVHILTNFLSSECEFRGNSKHYYDPKNSFLTDVLDRHLGIPISLACVYIEVGKRVGITLEGISFPYHFLLVASDVDDLFIDPFHGGKILDAQACQALLAHLTDGRLPFSESYLFPVTSRQLLVRAFRNLKNIYVRNGDVYDAIRMSDLIITWAPDAWIEYRDRGLMRLDRQQLMMGISDLEEYLANVPNAPDQSVITDHLNQALYNAKSIN